MYIYILIYIQLEINVYVIKIVLMAIIEFDLKGIQFVLYLTLC